MTAKRLGGNGFLLPLLIGGLGMGILAGAQTSQRTAPKVTVGKQLTAKASAPSPGATAKNTAQKTSIGKGATSVKASQPSSKRGVLYSYREDDFACPNGKPESGSILMALYATGNEANKPVGSGWYLVNVDAGKCAAKRSATFGCRFDANGNATECGAATVNNGTGEIDVVVAR